MIVATYSVWTQTMNLLSSVHAVRISLCNLNQ
jgi:hypothetical protein